MRKLTLILSLIFLNGLPLFSQFTEGYNQREALEMIAICNSFTFQDVMGTDKEILPKNYKKIYQSESMGMDNKWQLLEGPGYAVINIRGSTTDPLNWITNLYSAMIPANGSISLPDGTVVNYCLSDNPLANVHSGWTLAMVFLSGDIVSKIKELNEKGIYYFIITGHSQGAAIAQLMRSYVENVSPEVLDKKNEFKTYVFASPKPANTYFARNYSNYYKNSSFIINNPKDPVINLPLSKDDDSFFDLEEAHEQISDTNRNYFKTLAIKAVGRILTGNKDSLYIRKSGVNIQKQLNKYMGPIQMPAYVPDMDYTYPVNPIYIEPFMYFNFNNKKYYREFDMDSSKVLYQHKPYLYFLEYQREFFYDEYLKW
ncbi:MAG: hypothetical protein C0595_11340 [Marinilabiliales bacterium]|nr:MAG: hypothetical protein C0595_11340 [Marinilabiliales bacterium]